MAGLDVQLGGRKRPTIIGGSMLGLGFPAADPAQGGGAPANVIRLNGAAIKLNGNYIKFTKAA